MTEKSDKLMEKLVQIAEWAIDDEIPIGERLNLIPKIHDVTLSIRKELPNMSNEDKVDISMRLIILESIVRSAIKLGTLKNET